MREGCLPIDYLGKEVVGEGQIAPDDLPNVKHRALVGEAAPDFSAMDVLGHVHRLHLKREQTHVVLVFIRSASSAACRRQLQDLQRHLAEFRRLDAEVLVLSDDSWDALKALRSDLGLDLTVLQDAHHQFASVFSRPESSSGAEPMVLIVDRHGLTRFKAVTSGDAKRPSSAQLLSVLKELNVPARR